MPANGQPQAGPAKTPAHRIIGLHKRLEELGLSICRNPNAAVDDVYFQSRRMTIAQSNHDADRAVFGELDGIANQVNQDLPQPSGIGLDRFGNGSFAFDSKRKVLAHGTQAHQRFDIGNQFAHLARPRLDGHLSGFDLGNVENVVNDGEQVLGVVLNGPDRFEPLLWRLANISQLVQ